VILACGKTEKAFRGVNGAGVFRTAAPFRRAKNMAVLKIQYTNTLVSNAAIHIRLGRNRDIISGTPRTFRSQSNPQTSNQRSEYE
jgi:hypothetical protein